MDRKFQQRHEIERLVRLSESARSSLEVEAIALKHRLDIPSRIRDSLKTHPTRWLLGSLGFGLVASLLFKRKSVATEIKRRSLPVVLFGLALTAIRPFAKVWLADQVKHYFAAQLGGPLGRRSPITTTYPPQPL